MGIIYIVCIVVGILTLVFGIFEYNHPELAWELSLSRRLFVHGGEPTNYYYETQRKGAIVLILIGGGVSIAALIIGVMANIGYSVHVDEFVLKLPCTYSEIEEMGYEIEPDATTRTVSASNNFSNYHISYTARNAEGKEIKIYFENRTNEEQRVLDCEVVGIEAEFEDGPILRLPNGIEIGMSETEAKQIRNNSSHFYMQNGLEFKETLGFERYNITIYFEDDKVGSIEVMHNNIGL